jgi:hypothetical protein
MIGAFLLPQSSGRRDRICGRGTGSSSAWWVAICLSLLPFTGCSSAPKPNERVTGDCTRAHCSSRQSTVDLDAAQRAGLQVLEEHSYLGLSRNEGVTAASGARQRVRHDGGACGYRSDELGHKMLVCPTTAHGSPSVRLH